MKSRITTSDSAALSPDACIGKTSIFLCDLDGQTMFSDNWQPAVEFLKAKSAALPRPRHQVAFIRISIAVEGGSRFDGQFRDYEQALSLLDFAASRTA
jgi:hypothetical protein